MNQNKKQPRSQNKLNETIKNKNDTKTNQTKTRTTNQHWTEKKQNGTQTNQSWFLKKTLSSAKKQDETQKHQN